MSWRDYSKYLFDFLRHSGTVTSMCEGVTDENLTEIINMDVFIRDHARLLAEYLMHYRPLKDEEVYPLIRLFKFYDVQWNIVDLMIKISDMIRMKNFENISDSLDEYDVWNEKLFGPWRVAADHSEKRMSIRAMHILKKYRGFEKKKWASIEDDEFVAVIGYLFTHPSRPLEFLRYDSEELKEIMSRGFIKTILQETPEENPPNKKFLEFVILSTSRRYYDPRWPPSIKDYFGSEEARLKQIFTDLF